MRKRSNYRPKGVIGNPLAYVMDGFRRLDDHSGGMLRDVQIKNHLAMTKLTKGEATKQDLTVLIHMANMCEALFRMGLGTQYGATRAQGKQALVDVCARGLASSRFILRASEMQALNELMELHDAQMQVVTVREMEDAIRLVNRELNAKRMIKIKDFAPCKQ